jgi:hypothetical protein
MPTSRQRSGTNENQKLPQNGDRWRYKAARASAARSLQSVPGTIDYVVPRFPF